MRSIIVLTAVLFAGTASGSELLNRVINMCPSPPPLEYRQTPTVQYEIHEWPLELIDPMCSPDGEARYAMGYIDACAVGPVDDGVYLIYLRNDFDPFRRWCAIWHEKGHLPPNKWKH